MQHTQNLLKSALVDFLLLSVVQNISHMVFVDKIY